MMTEPSHDNENPPAWKWAASYFSGALSPEEAAAYEAAMRDAGPIEREAFARMRAVARRLFDGITPAAPSPSLRQRLLDRIRSEEADAPPVWSRWSDDAQASDLYTLRREESPWEETGIPGVQVRRLFVDRPNNRMTAIFRMAPGTSYRPHRHDGPEECLVLEGELHVSDSITLRAGDYQRAPAGSDHGLQSTRSGCLLLITCSLTDEPLEPAA